ncbi:MAG: hypothetical protein JWQ90_371 [Hydrocarboniphaga sp.]|nr:hypothetical protein [Hydrocarboniphaga sp.]
MLDEDGQVAGDVASGGACRPKIAVQESLQIADEMIAGGSRGAASAQPRQNLSQPGWIAVAR